METGNNYNKEPFEDLKLILYIDQDSFSYSIFNKKKNSFLVVKNYSIENYNFNTIKNIIESDSYLIKKKSYKTLCVIDSYASTFIPTPLFDKSNIDNYINIVSEKDKAYQTKYVKQQFSDSYLIFKLKKDLLELIEKNFQLISLKSTASLIVDYALSLQQLKDNLLLVQVNKSNFHITLIKNGQFIFYNKFHFDTHEDFVYYLMNCLHTLSIPIKNKIILVMSNINKEDILFKKIKKYTQISFMQRPEKFIYENSIIIKESHKHHNLISQIICE